MKKACVLVIALIALMLSVSGCGQFFAQPGETTAEGHRRHIRNLTINNQELWDDIDTALQMDKPSKLTDMRIR